MLKAARTLGIVFFPAFDWAISPTHPERQERLLYTQDQLREEGVFDIPGISEIKPDLATAADVARVHFCFPDVAAVTTASHMISAGGAIRAGRLVLEKETARAFALVRPPGHPAMKVVHGSRGLCNINIEAVMIKGCASISGLATWPSWTRNATTATAPRTCTGSTGHAFHFPPPGRRTLYPGTGYPYDWAVPGARRHGQHSPAARHLGRRFLYELGARGPGPSRRCQTRPVIKSGGQDNTFSDPITDMASRPRATPASRTCSGRTRVLEGGYSIQGASPTSTWVCPFHGGINYAQCAKPGFDPASVRQSAKVTVFIRRSATNSALTASPNRQGRTEKGWFTRRKTAYYDYPQPLRIPTVYVRDCDIAGVCSNTRPSPREIPWAWGSKRPSALRHCLDEALPPLRSRADQRLYRNLQLMTGWGKTTWLFPG
jgi:acetoin utilization deacetylase AcuC-like enzyme